MKMTKPLEPRGWQWFRTIVGAFITATLAKAAWHIWMLPL